MLFQLSYTGISKCTVCLKYASGSAYAGSRTYQYISICEFCSGGIEPPPLLVPPWSYSESNRSLLSATFTPQSNSTDQLPSVYVLPSVDDIPYRSTIPGPREETSVILLSLIILYFDMAPTLPGTVFGTASLTRMVAPIKLFTNPGLET